jgi:tetratricopeptide (TPR) repeat protein
MSASDFLERYEALKAAHDQNRDKNNFLVGLRGLLAEATNSNDEPWVLSFSARIASVEAQHVRSLEILDRLLALGGGHPELLERPPFLWVPISKGFCLGELDRKQEAINVYDDVVARLGARKEVALAEQVAKALFNKSFDLGKLDRKAEAIKVCDDVVARFGARQEVTLAEQVAKALVNKGVCLAELDRRQEAINVYDDVVARFGARQEVTLAERVAKALVNKSIDLGKLDREEEAIKVCDDVVARFGARQEVTLAEAVARALVDKGFELGKLNQKEGAIRVYDEVLARFGARTEMRFVELVVRAIGLKALVFEQQNQHEAALESWAQVITVCDKNDLRSWQSSALVQKSHVLEKLGRKDEATKARTEAQRLSPDSAVVRQAEPLSNHAALVQQVDTLLKNFVPEKRRSFGEEIQKRRRNTGDFLRAESRFADEFSLLFVLREWNSYTPIIPSEQETDRGGGYFLRHHGKGIVIDPGYDFIENFYNAGGRVHDIDAVVITHAHDDHTADFEALMTLLHQFNGVRRKDKGESRKVSLYLSIGAERKLSGFFRLREDDRIVRTVVLNRCEGSHVQQLQMFSDVTLTVLPAYHDDLITADSSVGLCFDLQCAGGPRRIVFSGDTGLYPKELDETGRPKKSQPDSAGDTASLLATSNRDDALYRRYEVLLSKIDGGEARPIDLLVPHLGSIQDYELEEPSLEPGKALLYANHLGLRGMAIFLKETHPRAAIISEFGSELKNIKREIIGLLQDALSMGAQPDAVPFIVPGDVTIVYDIDKHQFLCHATRQFAAPGELEICEDADQGTHHAGDSRLRTYLMKRSAPTDHRAQACKRYHEELATRKLPYFRNSGG